MTKKLKIKDLKNGDILKGDNGFYHVQSINEKEKTVFIYNSQTNRSFHVNERQIADLKKARRI